MKKWQAGLGILVVVSIALSFVLMKIGPKTDTPSVSNGGTTAQAGEKQSAADPKTNLPEPGNQAPDFALTDFEGKTVKLSDFRGKPVLLNFWASWCGPCRLEAPDLVRKSEIYKGKIVFLGVNLTNTEQDPEGPKKFLQEFNVKYQNLLDKDGKVATTYQVIGIPTTLTIAPDGTIVDRSTGILSEAAMERIIQKLLNKTS